MEERVFSNTDVMNRAIFDHMMRILRESVAQRGRFVIALSGGRTPARLYALWGQAHAGKNGQTPWDKVHLFWGDERYVPKDDPLSNYHMTREALIDEVPIPAANVHALPTELPTPEEAAKAYEEELRKFFGDAPPVFDLQLLGLGTEGHTASIFPGSPALTETKRWVMAVEAPANPPHRITFTLPVLNIGRNTFFLVTGADKREIITAIRQEADPATSQYPAARVQPANPPIWYLDDRAAH
jgi:6-phosphogluconolactonase